MYFSTLCQGIKCINIKNFVIMSTLGERIKIVQIKSGLLQPQFAKSLGISKETLIHYQKDRRHPDSVFLSNLCKTYKVNPAWLLLGEGEPMTVDIYKVEAAGGQVAARDLVAQLLKEEEERAGVTLTPRQRTAIQKILRELIYRDVRSIRELLLSIHGEEEQGEEA
jgi:transcriptional regulator with XRE-family HTH domain